MTKIKLGHVSDPGIYIFFEKGTIGGISYVSNKYSKANNRYLNTNDPKQKSKRIIYSDANNLCAYAMSKFLPASGPK